MRYAGRNVGPWQNGYSLLELLIVLAIAGLLLGWGNWGELLAREKRFQATLELRRSLNFARSQAVFTGSAVTLCALDENGDCQREWDGRDYAVFNDADRDRHLDPEEALRLGHWPDSRGQLTWRAALARRYLVFTPGGATAQNGSFWFCPVADRAATRIVVNRAGRNYVDETNTETCQ